MPPLCHDNLCTIKQAIHAKSHDHSPFLNVSYSMPKVCLPGSVARRLWQEATRELKALKRAWAHLASVHYK